MPRHFKTHFCSSCASLNYTILITLTQCNKFLISKELKICKIISKILLTQIWNIKVTSLEVGYHLQVVDLRWRYVNQILAYRHVALHMWERERQVTEANQRNRNLDEQNSEERRAYTSRQNVSISPAIMYLNAVPVISCCPLFDNNLRPPATTRFLAAASNENRNKMRKQLCVSTDYGCWLNNKLAGNNDICIFFFNTHCHLLRQISYMHL